MESKSGVQDQSKFPIIIAIKGPSNNKKSEIATKLATFLQYPLMDEADIVTALQNSIPTSSIDDLPFKTLCHISSTQLNLKLNVILNTVLSEHNHFIDLLQLASSKEAFLLIIQCDNAFDHYDVGHIPKLNIDTHMPFIVEEFVPTMLSLVEFPQGKSSEQLPQDNNIINKRFLTERHAHEFNFIEEPENGFEKLICNCCKEQLLGSTYQCVVCNEFSFHELCPKSPNPFSQDLRESCPSYIRNNPPEYSFPKRQKCKLCEEFSDSCNDCLLQTHIECGFLPTIIEYKRHSHPLNFVIMPHWLNYKYLCFICNKFGESISYKCYQCNLDFHIDCVLLKTYAIEDKFSAYINRAKAKLRTTSSIGDSSHMPISQDRSISHDRTSIDDTFSDYINRVKVKLRTKPSNIGDSAMEYPRRGLY